MRGSAEPFRSKTPHHRDYTSAVYGSVLAASVIIGAGALRAPIEPAVVLRITGAIFWLAHVYAETSLRCIAAGPGESIGKGLRHEWPLLFASIPRRHGNNCRPVSRLSITNGSWMALGVALVELQIWGGPPAALPARTGRSSCAPRG